MVWHMIIKPNQWQRTNVVRKNSQNYSGKFLSAVPEDQTVTSACDAEEIAMSKRDDCTTRSYKKPKELYIKDIAFEDNRYLYRIIFFPELKKNFKYLQVKILPYKSLVTKLFETVQMVHFCRVKFCWESEKIVIQEEK